LNPHLRDARGGWRQRTQDNAFLRQPFAEEEEEEQFMDESLEEGNSIVIDETEENGELSFVSGLTQANEEEEETERAFHEELSKVSGYVCLLFYG
jgi:hypothetical protein